MSDYFGALLRSSGVQVADTARPLAAQPTLQEASAPPLDEQLGEHITAPPALDTASSIAPATTVQAPEASATRSPLAMPTSHAPATPPVVTSAEQRSSGPIDAGAEAQSATPAATASESPRPVTASERATAAESLSTQGLTRAVLRWVASDPAQIPRLTNRESATAAPVPVVKSTDTTESAARSLPSSRAAREAFSPPWEQTPIVEAANDTLDAFESADEPTPRATPARANHATLLSADPFAQPMYAHEDVIEVSIGAVHVRVDAPPELAVSRATTPPAARTAAPSPRSSLARRALRRV